MQKTAYEMRISDWSSDVCSSDLEIGEEPALQQRVVAEIDAGDDVRRQEGGLLGFGEEIVDVAVERHAADDLDGDILLGDQLGGVEHVIGLLCRERLVEDLHAEIPRREVAGIDRLEQVAAQESSAEHTSELQSLMRTSYAV